MAAQSLREAEQAVGITAFVSPDAPGFECTIKHRYTDFLVNEILPDGTVLHLLDDTVKGKKKQKDSAVKDEGEDVKQNGHAVETSSPGKRKRPEDAEETDINAAAPAKKQKASEEEPTSNNGAAESVPPVAQSSAVEISISDADKSTLHGIFGEATTTKILSLYTNVLNHPTKKPREHPTIKSEVIEEKSTRTEAHVAVRKIFQSKLSTETLQDLPGVIAIRAAPTKGPTGARNQPNSQTGAISKGKLGWEELGGEYLHFTLYKENKDTMEVLYFLATQIKIPVKNFQFAGTKDRRGVTVQRVALYRVHAERIVQINKMARGFRLGGFEYKKHGLDLGELNGNEFLLTLRDCHFNGEEALSHEERLKLAETSLQRAADSFQTHGYLNYYGLQRFGTFMTGTHSTGKKMLKGDLQGAVDSILAYSDSVLPENIDPDTASKIPQDDINRADAIKAWRENGNSSERFGRMPRRFQAEVAIMQHLGKKDPKTKERLQAHDYQGALMMIQRNLRLMYVHAYQSFVWNHVVSKRWELYGGKVVAGDLVIVGEKDDSTPVAKDTVDEEGEPIFHPTGEDSAPVQDPFTRARPLSQEELDSGKYDCFDIVLPLPGFDVVYPDNEVGTFYKDFMASELGGGLDPHDMRRSWKDISLSGSYRKMMAKPGPGFTLDVKGYGDSEEQMVETDLERLRGGREKKRDVRTTEEEEGDTAEKMVGVVVKMKLGSSQYATMALRELTKGGAVNYKPEYAGR